MSNKIEFLKNICIVLIISIFVFSLFKNISYPLLWNDEASTAMFGKRVLEYGYPKVWDGKNSLYLLNDENFNIGVREKGDIYIAEGWTQFYLSALGNYFADKVDDIYQKTAIMRISFVLVGFLAIIIFGITISLFFKENKKKAFIAFFLFELFSISLLLHIREVRYYSLILLFGSILINVYLRYIFLKTLNYKNYVWMISLFLVLLFHTHYPIAFIFIFTFGLYSLYLVYLESEKKLLIFVNKFLKLTLPLFISFIFIISSLIYFKTFKIMSALSLQSGLNFQIYLNNIFQALSFFAKFEFFYFAIFLKILLISFLYFKKDPLNLENKIILKTSNFLSLFFCIYILIISRTVFVFERYIIVLQPVLICIILLDILLCWHIFHQIFKTESSSKKEIYRFFIGIISIAIWINSIPLMEPIKGYIYQLSHIYKGPLDFSIPYIKENFKDPSKLIIATNYEENSYMYYLNSKTIVGYVGNNLEEDKKLEPDIIINRKYFDFHKGYTNIFNTFFDKNKYKEVNFPIYDYAFNNIPELNFTPSHLFKTKYAEKNNEKLFLYLKE